MRFSTIFSASALSITLPLFASARHGSLNARKHRDVSRRDGIAGLFTNTRFTYYDISVGQVACEGWHKPSEFVVALNGAQYGTYWKSPSCGKEIIINFGGKTARATVVDMCPGCPYGGLDLTQGLFEYFSDVSAGVIHGSWSWADGSSGGGSVDSGADYIVAAAPAAKAASYTRPAVAKPASTQPAASKPKSTLKTPKPQTQKPQTQKPQSQKPQTPKPQAPKQQAPKPPTIPNKPSKPKVTPKPVAIPATPKPKIVASLGGNGTTTSQAPAPTNKCPGRLRSRAQMNVADWS